MNRNRVISAQRTARWLCVVVSLQSALSAATALGDDAPIDPTPLTIKVGEARLFRVKDQGKVYLTCSASWRCGAYVLGDKNSATTDKDTAKGVLLVAFVAGERPIEVTVSSDSSLVVYRITVVEGDASITPAKDTKVAGDALEEVTLQEVSLKLDESRVYPLPRGPVRSLCTETWAICTNVLGDENTKRGFRVEAKQFGYGYVAVTTSDPKDMKLFKFAVK
jgi:hypothetical protein